jgi:hypothetical protein
VYLRPACDRLLRVLGRKPPSLRRDGLAQRCDLPALDSLRDAPTKLRTPDPGPSDSISCCDGTRDGEIARRNVLFGVWAGRRLGLTGDDLETYAWSVHFADRDRAGRRSRGRTSHDEAHGSLTERTGR